MVSYSKKRAAAVVLVMFRAEVVHFFIEQKWSPTLRVSVIFELSVAP